MFNWIGGPVGNDDAISGARSKFGFKKWKPGQLELIKNAISGLHTLGILPTGGGKSLVEYVPALLRPRGELTVIAAPLIALIRQHRERLQAADVQAAELHSGLSEAEISAVYDRISSGQLNVLVTTPEQLVNKMLRAIGDNVRFARLEVDEAHCVSEWGNGFRIEYGLLGQVIERFLNGVGAHTATASAAVRKDIIDSLRMIDPFIFDSEIQRDNLKYRVHKCEDANEKKAKLLELLKGLKRGKGGTIVYCPTVSGKNGTDEVWELLKTKVGDVGKIAVYHGSVAPSEKVRIEEGFRTGEIKVLIATSAFGMGMDKPDVRAVIHFESPGSPEDYLQQTGRAGRDGKLAQCILLHCDGGLRVQEYFNRGQVPSIEFLNRVYRFIVNAPVTRPVSLLQLKRALLPDPTKGARPPNPITSTHIGSALRVLFDCGALKMRGSLVVKGDREFGEGSEAMPVAESILLTRGKLARGSIEAMKRYIDFDGSDQDRQALLIRMMKEDS